ncbi:MAG: recombination protein RecR [Ruminococcaceae bacterium]|nr:recombination protein RecR [Oscillospiraceae bacterium]
MASEYIEPLERLADMFRRLDGVGKKTALRYAFSVLNFTEDEAREFADALVACKTEVVLCGECQNISTDEVCPICSSPNRDGSTVCVVEDPRAVYAIEKTRQFGGVYHVLHGTLSPMRGITPDRLKIKELLQRISKSMDEGQTEIKELILATNPTVEGEATAMYIAKLLTPLGVKVTRIANGVPVGGDLEYADEVTLRRAMEGRYTIG